MLTKVKSSTQSFDLIFPSGDHVSILRELDMLEELDKTKLTNYGNLDTSLLKKRNHSIPIMPMPSLMLGAYWADV